MNTLTHISNNLDDLFVNWMVNDMLNPDNKDLYIGTLTLDKVEAFFNAMPQYDDVAEVFWRAYHIAEKQFYKQAQVEVFEELNSLDERIACPECGCQEVIQGIACPNCECVA